MQQEATVTSQGQVTIPEEIRRVLGIHEGDSVIFEADASGVHLRPARVSSVFAQYAGIWREGEGLTVDDLNACLRDMRGHDE
jgi:AbrB family looped-hinge helix DNA binding protein